MPIQQPDEGTGDGAAGSTPRARSPWSRTREGRKPSPLPRIPESTDFIDFSSEDVTFTRLPTEVLTIGQSSASLCPASVTSSGFQGQVIVRLYFQPPAPETGNLIDVSAEEENPSEPSVEELVSGQTIAEHLQQLQRTTGRRW